MSQIQQVKEATDLVGLIGARISLKRSGTNYRALCPFHNEKTPSFFVNEGLQRYKCFGCGESGDVFSFLQKYEGMTFYESLQYLAQKAGIKLETNTRTDQDDHREKLKEVLEAAAAYYHFLLTKHQAGQKALAYLKSRQVSQASIKKFRLGYALDSWQGLIAYLHGKKKYDMRLLEQAGLAIRGQASRYYDRFRGRLIFPLEDRRGQVVGFAGRVLDQEQKQAKYINSPETVLYHKSELLYGFYQAFDHVRDQKQAVLVEGELDVISSHQAKVKTAMALKGSALTDKQVKLLARLVETVILALDTDEAGLQATQKAILALQNTDIELKVALLESGKDPDDLARTNPRTWRQAVKQAMSAHSFLIWAAAKQFDPQTPRGKRQILKAVAASINSIQHEVEREYYIRELAEVLATKRELVTKDLTRYQHQTSSLTGSRSIGFGQAGRSGRDGQDEQDEQGRKDGQDEQSNSLESYLLFLLIHSNPSKLGDRFDEIMDLPSDLDTQGAQAFVMALYDLWTKRVKKSASKSLPKSLVFDLIKKLPEDLQEKAFRWYAQERYLDLLPQLKVGKEWKTTLSKVGKKLAANRAKQISQELSQLDAKPKLSPSEQDRQSKLLKDLVLLRRF